VGRFAEVNVLLDRIDEILPVFGLLRQAQFGLDGDGVGEAAFDAFGHGVLRFFDVVLHELQEEILPGVGAPGSSF